MIRVSNIISLSFSQLILFSISLFGLLHRDATFYDHRSRCQKKHPQRQHTLNECIVIIFCTKCTLYLRYSCAPFCSNVKVYFCTYISQVYIHNRCAILRNSLLTFLHIYISLCIYMFVISTRVSICICISLCTLYTFTRLYRWWSRHLCKGTRASLMIAFRMLLLTAYWQRERTKRKSTMFPR